MKNRCENCKKLEQENEMLKIQLARYDYLSSLLMDTAGEMIDISELSFGEIDERIFEKNNG